MLKQFNIRKAAMFGLDARIALAIFGALSVITGAALYSAIQKAHTTAFLTDLNEAGKAFEQYYLDTGMILPRGSNDSAVNDYYSLKSYALINNIGSVKGWKGPYLNYSDWDGYSIKYRDKGALAYFVLNRDGPLGGTDHWISSPCTTGKNCYLWIHLNSYDSTDDFQALDSLIDKGDGSAAGAVRWAHDVNFKNVLYYRYMPLPN